MAMTKKQTLAWLRNISGEMATTTLATLEAELPWYRAMPPSRRSAVGMVAQTGITSFIAWHEKSAVDSVDCLRRFRGGPPRASSLRQLATDSATDQSHRRGRRKRALERPTRAAGIDSALLAGDRVCRRRRLRPSSGIPWAVGRALGGAGGGLDPEWGIRPRIALPHRCTGVARAWRGGGCRWHKPSHGRC